MIKEENIERLSDEQRKEILDNGGALGLYRINSSYKWRERLFVTNVLFLDSDFDVLECQNFHEWQAPPTDSIEKCCGDEKCDDCKWSSHKYRGNDNCLSCAENGDYAGYEKQTRPMTAIEIAQFIAKNGYVLCNTCNDESEVIYNASLWNGDIGDPTDISSYRYLKPDSDKLYVFEEVS